MIVVRLFIGLTIYFFIAGAISCDKKKDRYFSESAYKMILERMPRAKDKELTIYYMDGDCSFCIAKAIAIEKDLKDTKNVLAIFVAVTNNPATIEYYFKKSNIQDLLISSRDSILKNSNVLFNEVVMIQKNRKMSTIHKYD